MQAVQLLARLCGCIGSSEPIYAISTKTMKPFFKRFVLLGFSTIVGAVVRLCVFLLLFIYLLFIY